MTRPAASVKTANHAIKIALLAMVALVAVTFVVTAADAALPKDSALKDFEADANQFYKYPKLEATWDALEAVPGPLSNPQVGKVFQHQPEELVAKAKRPKNVAPQAQAHAQGQQTQSGNNAGDIAREQAIQSIDYCSRFMKNFTTEGGNRWNRYRDGFFVPMALLLILPGAVLTQVRAIIAQGNPILVGQSSPLEGIQRAIIGIFLVPSTYLIVNYSIDLGNSLQYTIATEYTRLQGTDMYEDAMCAEIRAFGVRYLKENEGALNTPVQDEAPRGNDPFAKLEGKLWGKLADPCVGLLLVPSNRDDTSMGQGAIGTRLAMNMTNAGINTAWSILTAFQMAFMYYLFFVGPIMAALWVWPMKMFKDAFPAWTEGVVTLAFWSFFWNVVILILALTKSEASSGLYTVSACNFLASAAVKYAFDFAGLMRGAAAEAEKLGAKAAQQAGKGGGKGGNKGGSQNPGTPAATPAATPAPAPAPATAVAATNPGLIPKPTKVAAAKRFDHLGRELDANGYLKDLGVTPVAFVKSPVVFTSLPPLDVQSGRLMTIAGLDPQFTNPLGDPTLGDTSNQTYTFGINQATGTFNDPVKMPPMAGGPVVRTRNTIGSVIGNAIQAIFAYPSSAKIVDPDSAVRTVEKREKPAIDFVETIECETEIEPVRAAVKFETPQAAAIQEPTNLNQTPTEIIEAEESEMKNVAPPSTVKVQEERFSFTPPPMVEADKGKSFDATMSVSDIPLEAQTCNSLLTKMSDVVSDNHEYAPAVVPNANLFAPQAPAPQPIQAPALSFAEELAQVYAAHMPRVFAEQEAQRQTSPNYTGPIQSFVTTEPVQEEVITVVDFTTMAAPVAHAVQSPVQAQPQQPKQTNTGLNGILSNRGVAKAPVNQDVSNSWFA